MNEEKAKKVLQEQIDKYGQEYDAEGIEALEMAIKALEQTSWIPVSEKLPESDKWCLVTTKEAVTKALYYEYSEYWKEYVIAWMPLPQPYKVESEE